MGAIINRISHSLNRLVGRICGFESGDFELSRGHHEITVPIYIEADSVWTKLVSCGCHDGCGQFPVNKISTFVKPCEITFIIDIESNMAKINWFATS